MARYLLRYLDSTVLLAPGAFTLGRGTDCGLQIDDVEVSRKHAVLHLGDDGLSVEDLGSRNGIYLNGERVAGRAALGHGDVLSIGKQKVRIIEEEERMRRAVMTTVQTEDESNEIRSELPPPLDGSAGGEIAAETAEALDRLSNREREVLRLVALGYAQKEIAAELGVSVKTVETYRTRINDKLGFKSRVELVRFAIDAGMMSE